MSELIGDQTPAQDCEMEYWLQQAENYAEVQIPADDLRAIIARAYAAVNALPELLALREENARMREALNTPEVEDFAKAVVSEAQHQRERWGADHDKGKAPLDWFWLVGYLAQKAATSAMSGDTEKAKHHTISTSAALANWHAALAGHDNRMVPGAPLPIEAEAEARAALNQEPAKEDRHG